jgi:hypothetical protein
MLLSLKILSLLKFYLSKKVVCRSQKNFIHFKKYDFLIKIIAEKTAELLLQINAIKLESRKPFTWPSSESPIYCDNRLILISTNKKLYEMRLQNSIEKQFASQM